jgi:hypothetical protein
MATKLLRGVEDLEAQIKNRPLAVWEMRMVAASTMECLEKMTDGPEFTPVDYLGKNAYVLTPPSRTNVLSPRRSATRTRLNFYEEEARPGQSEE